MFTIFSRKKTTDWTNYLEALDEPFASCMILHFYVFIHVSYITQVLPIIFPFKLIYSQLVFLH